MAAAATTSGTGSDVQATVVDALRRAGSGSAPDEIPLRVDRYVVLRSLGEGAMGQVLLAYDAQLDRRVAIKLVRSLGQRASEVHARMLREAQGLARLSHPNVVQIYEVGQHDGQVYLVMEYIEGETLRTWSIGQARSWRERLACCLDAGRGLAAAHAAGLVHRDFKPDNVVISREGRACVLDFGLVRAGHEGPAADRSLTASASISGSRTEPRIDSELTDAQHLIGTPAYMSPEQHRRAVADARSDIFSYCVVLYETLYGVRPFAGKDQATIMRAVLGSEITAPPEGRRVPQWVRRVILRGLEVDVGQRWQAMDELLVALQRDPWAAPRRWALAGFAFTGVAAGLAGVTREEDVCPDGEAELAGTWDDERRAEVKRSIGATSLGYADAVATRVLAGLDDYRAEWLAMRRDACLDHRHGEHSGELLDLRMACLEQRRRELAAVVRLLTAADPHLVERASEAVGALPRIAVCGDTAYLQASLRPPDEPALAAAVDAQRGVVTEAYAFYRAGRYAQGLAHLADAVDPAVRRAYPPLGAELELIRGRLLHGSGAYADAETALESAYYEARALGHDVAAIEAATWLVAVVAALRNDFAGGERWARIAEAELRHAGTVAQQGELSYVVGELHLRRGEFEVALAHFDRALASRREALGDDSPFLVEVLVGAGVAHFKRGRDAEAQDHFERARRAAEVAFGPDHPQMGHILGRLGMVASRARRFDEAAAALTGALKILEDSLGPQHVKIGEVLSSLGELEFRRRDFPRAAAYFERAAAVTEATHGPNHGTVGALLSLRAGALFKQEGATDRVHELLARSVAISAAGLGEDHVHTAVLRSNLAEILNERGRHDEARAELLQALPSMARGIGADRPELGPIHRELARALLGLGEPAAAEQHARQAVALSGAAANVDPEERAANYFVLAQVLRATGGDPAEVHAAAEQARDLFDDLPHGADRLAALDAWLARPAPRPRRRR